MVDGMMVIFGGVTGQEDIAAWVSAPGVGNRVAASEVGVDGGVFVDGIGEANGVSVGKPGDARAVDITGTEALVGVSGNVRCALIVCRATLHAARTNNRHRKGKILIGVLFLPELYVYGSLSKFILYLLFSCLLQSC